MIPEFSAWPLAWIIGVFGAGAVLIALLGTRLTGLADRLADRTGLGEAFMGAVFLGAATSLPGITASVTAAWDGHASLALSNAYGGIAAQTAFLAIADLAYRKANLEHAAASLPNLMWGALLLTLLAVLMLGMTGPQWSFLGVHPVTPALFAIYFFGMRLIYRTRAEPMWKPRMTKSTRVDVPDPEPAGARRTPGLWLDFLVTALLVISAGWVCTRASEALVLTLGLPSSVVGALLLAVATSLPELVTSVAAVRRGALTLAVGGVLGGNAFDTLFAGMADVAYRHGSIYAAAAPDELMLIAIIMIMAGVLLLGLLSRERRGIANIGFESFLVLVLYGVAVLLLNV